MSKLGKRATVWHAVRFTALAATLTAGLSGGLSASVWAAEATPEVRRLQERVDRLEAHLQNQGLLNLLQRTEEIKAEVARLRGALEEFAHQLQLTEQRQKDYYQDLDQRMKGLDTRLNTLVKDIAARMDGIYLQPAISLSHPVAEPAGVAEAKPAPPALPAKKPAGSTNVGSAPAMSPAEGLALYEEGSALFKKGQYADAVKVFERYSQTFPDSELTANALYWMGLSQFALEDFKAATATQKALIERFPRHAKRPDAMLSLARVYARLKDNIAARDTLDQLIAQYPKSKAAATGRKLRVVLD